MTGRDVRQKRRDCRFEPPAHRPIAIATVCIGEAVADREFSRS
jgi:hypothetical protein